MTVPSALTIYLVSLPFGYGNIPTHIKHYQINYVLFMKTYSVAAGKIHIVISKVTPDSKPQATRKKQNPTCFFTCLSLAAVSLLSQVPEEMPAISPEPVPSKTKPPGFQEESVRIHKVHWAWKC